MKIVKWSALQHKIWGGGTTTELLIYPLEANYSKRDFLFRLSIATIDIEQSYFTPLPGVRRELMLLKNELTLFHQNKYNIHLTPFKSDRFLGDWETKSIGKATDFNLMLMGETEGYLEHIEAQSQTEISVVSDCDFMAIYCATGKVELNNHICHVSDLIWLEPETKSSTIKLHPKTNVIVVRIWLNA